MKELFLLAANRSKIHSDADPISRILGIHGSNSSGRKVLSQQQRHHQLPQQLSAQGRHFAKRINSGLTLGLKFARVVDLLSSKSYVFREDAPGVG